MPDIIEKYTWLQKLRKAANLPLTNIACVQPSEADNTNTVRRPTRSSTRYCSSSATSWRRRARAVLPDRRPR